jgi:hypothetical protein
MRQYFDWCKCFQIFRLRLIIVGMIMIIINICLNPLGFHRYSSASLPMIVTRTKERLCTTTLVLLHTGVYVWGM